MDFGGSHHQGKSTIDRLIVNATAAAATAAIHTAPTNSSRSTLTLRGEHPSRPRRQNNHTIHTKLPLRRCPSRRSRHLCRDYVWSMYRWVRHASVPLAPPRRAPRSSQAARRCAVVPIHRYADGLQRQVLHFRQYLRSASRESHKCIRCTGLCSATSLHGFFLGVDCVLSSFVSRVSCALVVRAAAGHVNE